MAGQFAELMAQRGLTYAALSAEAKVSTRTLVRIRQGGAVTRRIGYRVARALGGTTPESVGIVTVASLCPREVVSG